MKNIIFFILLIPVMLLGTDKLQRLGLPPVSFTLDKAGRSFKEVSSFCGDGGTREEPWSEDYHYLESPELWDIKVDGKPFEGGIEKLIEDGDITIYAKDYTEVIFSLVSSSPYKTVSITIKETTIISKQKGDFELEKMWVNKLNSLKILPHANPITFAEAKPYIKSLQKKAGLEVSGLMDSETQDVVDEYSFLKYVLINYGHLKKDF